MVNIVMAGRFEDTEILAGVGLGNALLEIIGIGSYLGLNGALGTLVA